MHHKILLLYILNIEQSLRFNRICTSKTLLIKCISRKFEDNVLVNLNHMARLM